MRYRLDETPATAAANATDHALLLTAVLGLAIGVVLVWLGRRGRQFWLTSWSAGLVVCSIVYMGWILSRLA